MNILVKPYGSDMFHCRPDTTWERENKDFFSPECVNEIYWTPVVFARVCKAGKCVGSKFAGRYYDGIGCGMLMYCSTSGSEENSGDPRNPATAGCALQRSTGPFAESLATPTRGWENAISDHQPIRQLSHIVDKTSILPHPMYNPVVLDDEKVFTVIPDSDRESVTRSAPSVILSGAKHLLEDALCKASELTSLRIGDFIAVEMAAPAALARREDGGVAVKGTFCDNEIFDFRIIF